MSEQRCSLRAKPSGVDAVFGPNRSDNILYPLRRARRLYFPYTPAVQFGGRAQYDSYDFTHTNYNYPAYTNSSPSEIIITADLTSQTDDEARHTLAVMHFFKSITKSYFGRTSPNPGTPPPVILFNYLGDYNFKDVPVVVSNYSYLLEPDVDYVEIEDLNSWVPTSMNISVTLETFYNPKDLRDNFNIEEFTSGKLFKKGYL